MNSQGKVGKAAFQWNRGGWFGSQLGATLWLILLGLLLLAQSKPVGGLAVLCGLIPNLIGVWLWRRRSSVSAFRAIQCLIASCGLFAVFAMLGVRAAGLGQSSTGLPSLWFLLMYPGLMFVFYLRERSAHLSSR